MTTKQLQAQLDAANAALSEARKTASKPSEDVEAQIEAETRVSACERVVARLEGQLSEQVAWERAEGKRAERHEQETRKAELERLHCAGCDEMALAINYAARGLEPVFREVMEKRVELGRMSTEHWGLLRALTGKTPDPIQRLGFQGALVPEIEHRLDSHEYSPLYAALIAALTSAAGLQGQALAVQFANLPMPKGEDLGEGSEAEQALKLKARARRAVTG